MRSKILISLSILLLSLSSSCQVTKKVTYDSLENDLIEFLIKKGEIKENNIKAARERKYKIHVIGVINGSTKNELVDGIYVFSTSSSHNKAFYLIVENDTSTILDLSNREGLDSSIKKLLDFCERQKYCSDITEEYMKRMVGLYYRKNKNPLAGIDVNCESGVKDSNDLP